jgi:hypothetical protein
VTIKPKSKESKIEEGYAIEDDSDGYMYVYLSDLINYQRIIDVNANDISPAKQKIVIDKNQTSSKLYKEESTKILEAIVYSDLIGALEEESPNGIIQTEVSKKFNIRTTRSAFLLGGFGAFEYLEGKVLLSKIEKDNKFLLPTNNTFELLNLFQHRNFSVGGALNCASYENQNLKLNVFLESGIEFSRSGYKLSEDADERNLNSLEWMTQLKFHIFPEKRYGIIASSRFSYFEALDETPELLNVLNHKKNWINTLRLEAYLDVSVTSKLFVRYGLTHDLDNINNNFSSFQLGGAFYVLQKNRKDK